MFDKILIANRGEIACRVAATASRLGVRTVAVYSDADARSRHVAACDEAIHIGGDAAKDSYLRWERIIAAALASGAEAIHPGYGFLSENQEFAQACAAAGLVFIGPPPSAISAMGLKAESKRLMEAAGVPLVPGYHGTDQDPEALRQHADRIGYPVLIKASAGGGGKGMRAVQRAEDFAAALASCKREAINSFGDDAVLIERYVQRPRHVEIQVFGDTQGNCVYLFERDCSVQRRHQKVLEEAPAPGMSAQLRALMGQAAVDAARAVGYVGAGTVEFIVEQPQGYGELTPERVRFYFMEMNTRLQVEHPVTEAITGEDLVEWQLRVACGEPLPKRQDELQMRGHAIEARICAENPDKDFLPAVGQMRVARWPAHVAFARNAQGDALAEPAPVRLDAGFGQGDAISPFYDSMVAKLIVHGADREQALARLDSALAQIHIVGLATNVQFLRHVGRCESFARGELDTALIAREAAKLFDQQPVPLAVAAACAVAHALHTESLAEDADPFSRRDGWESHAERRRRFDFLWADQAVSAQLRYLHDGSLHLVVPAPGGAGPEHGAEGLLRWQTDGEALVVWHANRRCRAHVDAEGELRHVFTAQGYARLEVSDRLAHAGEDATEGGRLTAPMPGKLIGFSVQTGQAVHKGQPLAVMEAMKMEHTISAPSDGVVAELLFAPGDQVSEGAELLRLTATGRVNRP